MEHIGRYRVIRKLAQGGMGEVFLAEDPLLERQVAIKLLHRDPNRGLRREAKTLAALSHPNIVTVFEISEHDGQDFIAMEYLPGRSLRDILSDPSPPTREELLAIVSAVAVAVAAAHKSGILHRDIKPENVVTTPNGVKVVDFGIARRLEEKASNVSSTTDLYDVLLTPTHATAVARDTMVSAGTQTVFGTPAYMAPEVLGGEPSSEASDVYSLGVLLYECLAGHRPYDAGNLIETIAHIIQAPAPTLADPLNALLVRMFDREPSKRPTLIEIIGALRPGAAVDAPPRRKRRKRARWIALIAGAGAALAIAIATTTVVLGMRPAPASDPAPVRVKATIAIAPVVVEMPTWGVNRSDGDIVAATLAKVLGKAENADLEVAWIPGRMLGAQLQTARERGLEHLLVMRIDEDKELPQLTGTVRLFDTRTGGQTMPVRSRNAPSTHLRRLEHELLEIALVHIAPDARLPRVLDREGAQGSVNDGRVAIVAGDFDKARVLFEAAVAFDPTLPDAWYGLVLTLGWTEAPEDLVLQAAEKAYELAPSGTRKELMRGVMLYFQERFTESRLVLEKLEVAGDPGPDQLELLYFLGEANWHDGHHDVAHRYFERALAIPPRSRSMAIHPAQYLIARRQGDEARYIAGAAGLTDTEQIDISLRNYKKVAAGTVPRFRVIARVVLGEPVSDSDLASYQPLERAAYEIGRALERDDVKAARALAERVWADHIEGKRLNSADFYILEYFGEIFIAGNMQPEAKRLVKLLAESSKRRPRRGYHRLSNLTAALTEDRSLIVRDGASARNALLADAAEAELAGDHAKAASVLSALVENPTFTWDYPERAALIRNLRAKPSKRANDEVAAICKDTLEPAIYRHAYPVLRTMCRKR